MIGWHLEFKPAALRELSKLPSKVKRQVSEALERLVFEMDNPDEPRKSNIKALHGNLKGEYRLRCGDFRIRYALYGDRLVILVLQVGNRRDVYKD